MEPAGQPRSMSAEWSLTPCGSFVSSDLNPALFPATHLSLGCVWRTGRKEQNQGSHLSVSIAGCKALCWVLCILSVISLNFLNSPTG